MNKVSKSLLVLFLALLLGSRFSIFSAQAQDDKLILEVTKKCDFQYSGDSCVAELKITNNTGKVLVGEVFLHINYQGICGSGSFDGEGIQARFSVNNVDWLNFSGWGNGTTVVSGFEIIGGETLPKLKIETVPNLYPGEYTFTLGLKGTTKEGEQVMAPPVVIGGGGGGGASAYNLLSAEAQRVDANKDGKIDILDFNMLMIHWGETGTGNIADFNGDGIVNILDFNLLMVNWTI